MTENEELWELAIDQDEELQRLKKTEQNHLLMQSRPFMKMCLDVHKVNLALYDEIARLTKQVERQKNLRHNMWLEMRQLGDYINPIDAWYHDEIFERRLEGLKPN